MSANSTSAPISTPQPPRKMSIFEIPFGMDFTLYDEPSPDFPLSSEDNLDLEDITKMGVSKAFNFAQQEYRPFMYHPMDATGVYPEPFEWESKMFDDLMSPPRSRSPSVSSLNTTAPAPGSRRDSLQLSQSNISSRRSSLAENPVRSCRNSRQDHHSFPNAKNKRLSVLLSNFSFGRSSESLALSSCCRCCHFHEITSRRTSRTSLSIPPTSASRSTSISRSRSRRGSLSGRGNSLLLSHMGAGHAPYRMDSHSKELQKSVAGIPISAFIHPKLHIPASNDYGPVEDDGGFGDAYPLRSTRLWSFDEPDLPVEVCEMERYTGMSDAADEGASSFSMAGVV
ncbi:hypothetical protein ABW19_dt0203893 [Dactylella cylindrospora]|nr:hypothetical protein ABW19_dt0203893 [Dactylella cylindrospora]